MATRLPVVSGGQLVKLLTKVGFTAVRTRGSHITMERGERRTVVPLHREVAKGTLLSILRQCGLSRAEFVRLAGER